MPKSSEKTECMQLTLKQQVNLWKRGIFLIAPTLFGRCQAHRLKKRQLAFELASAPRTHYLLEVLRGDRNHQNHHPLHLPRYVDAIQVKLMFVRNQFLFYSHYWSRSTVLTIQLPPTVERVIGRGKSICFCGYSSTNSCCNLTMDADHALPILTWFFCII